LPTAAFHALDEARRHDPAARVPLLIEGRIVGSIAIAARDAVAVVAPWLDATPDGLSAALRGHDEISAAFAHSNAALRKQGLITGWRDEALALWGEWGHAPLAQIERASARFWGTLTLGAHTDGYVADGRGQPTALWIAERSMTKPTDPGKLDNLVGGGVPLGQTPRQALIREAWEEAGIDAVTAARATPGRVIEIKRALPDCAGHGLQWEWLFAFDLLLDPSFVPRNQDGEVAALRLVPIDEAIALAAGAAMTVDAALVTLDFALRHRLLAPSDHAGLEARLDALSVDAR
jgi:8-oxo-dGTP pyrophosphatase MutT (NUDIX family)